MNSAGIRVFCARISALFRYALALAYFLRSSSYRSNCVTKLSFGQVASHFDFISAAASAAVSPRVFMRYARMKTTDRESEA